MPTSRKYLRGWPRSTRALADRCQGFQAVKALGVAKHDRLFVCLSELFAFPQLLDLALAQLGIDFVREIRGVHKRLRAELLDGKRKRGLIALAADKQPSGRYV